MSAVELQVAGAYLDELRPIVADVGYGALGTYGQLGYEGSRVIVNRVPFAHALGTHPPARIVYDLDGAYRSFHCWVAFNDDVPAGATSADFVVRADGVEVGLVANLAAGDGPRELEADLTGRQMLELAVSTSRWEHCHAVWLEPRLEAGEPAPRPETLVDCLGRAEIILPMPPPRARRCVATVASPGYEQLLDDMLGSLTANGGCDDALRVVFAVGVSPEIVRVAAKHDAILVRCEPLMRPNQATKAILYSVARVIDADGFVCLDADTLVLGSLRPLFESIDALPEGSVLACREGNHRGFATVEQVLYGAYDGSAGDIERILGSDDGESAYPLAVNDGCFAGSRTALLAVDAEIRRMPGALDWMGERADVAWRNQFVFNLAVARLRAGVELDSGYNVQLHAQDVELSTDDGLVRARWQGKPVRVLHLSGWGRRKHRELRGAFASVADPLPRVGPGDAYASFVVALRAYAGRYGLGGLTWSFYGLPDGSGARVRDSTAFPVLGLLHYLVRANGCSRVLETGTARGISAACLASAVAHREGARVVTLDVAAFPERETLWAALPAHMRACIEPREVDAVEGLRTALEGGELYDAALIDSLHTTEQVWAEFEVVRRLVRPGGLILFHDVGLPPPHGGVEEALLRVEAAGYGVTRLFLAEGSIAEEERLGLGLVENRLRKGAAE